MGDNESIGVRLDLDKEQYAKDLDDSVNGMLRLKEMMDQLNKNEPVPEKARTSLQKFGEIARGTAKYVAGLAATALVAAKAMAEDMVKAQLQQIEALARQANMLGITTEAMAGLEHMAYMSGTGTETFTVAIMRLQRSLGAGAEGAESQSNALRMLHLTTQELIALSPDQAFFKVADAIGGMQNKTDQARMAFELFGRGGQQLLGIIRSNHGNFQALRDEAERLGLTFSAADAQGIQNFNKSIKLLHESVKGFWRHLTIQLSPTLALLSEEINHSAQEGGVVSQTYQALNNTIEKVVKNWATLIRLLDGTNNVYREAETNVNAIRSATEALDVAQRTGSQEQISFWDNVVHNAYRDHENAVQRLGSTYLNYSNILRGIGAGADQQSNQASSIRSKKAKELSDELRSLQGQAATFLGETLAASFVSIEDTVAKLKEKYSELKAYGIINAEEYTTTVQQIEAESFRQRADLVEALMMRTYAIEQGYTIKTANLLAQQNMEFNTQVRELQTAGRISAESSAYYQRTIDEEMLAHRVSVEQSMVAAKEASLRAQWGLDSRAFMGMQMMAQAGTQLMNSKNKELFKLGQASSIANIGMSAAEAIMKGYAMLGPFGGTAFAALMGLVAGVQIKEVLGQKPPKPAPTEVKQAPSFAKGLWEVPYDTLAIVHKGEMIKPDYAAKAERESTNSSSFNLHFHGDIYGMEDFENQVGKAMRNISKQTGNNFMRNSVYR